MIAIHEDDVAAEAIGINLTRTKLLAFALGSLIAGIAGGFYAHQALFIDANQFDFMPAWRALNQDSLAPQSEIFANRFFIF